jgi:hypothetical protein
MSDQDDSEDFMQVATKSMDSDDDRDSAKTLSKSEPTPMDDEERSESGIQNGKLVQWSHNGPGFVPATKTSRALPSAVYNIEFIGQIATFVPHKLITDNLLRLPDSKSDEVISDSDKFWDLKEIFKSFGFSHKRGFLLYGPPGSGKTITLTIIAEKIVQAGGIALIANIDPSIVSKMLKYLREIEPERRVVVLMEDIDTIIRNYGESEVLSLLDGESSINNVIYLATTNYPELLDGRVINRPSRFDKVIKIGTPNAASRKMYILSRKVNLTEEEVDVWVEQTEGMGMAHIKELIIGVCCFGNSFETEIKRIKGMAKVPKSDEGESMGFDKAKSVVGMALPSSTTEPEDDDEDDEDDSPFGDDESKDY